MHRVAKKLVASHLLGVSEEQDGVESLNDFMLKACALIRSNLHSDPLRCDDEDFAVSYAQALWLEQWRLHRQAEMIVSLFGENK